MNYDFVFIYIIMGLSLFLFTWPSSSDMTDVKWPYYSRIAIAVLVFSFIMGCRYEVGIDYMGTLEIYKDRQMGHQDAYLDYYEPIFYYLTTVLADLGAHFSLFFGTIAFLQITILILALRKYPKVLPFIFLSFFLECIWFAWANIMRHGLAHSFLILAISFLSQKKHFLFLACILLGMMIHNSTQLMFPLLFFYYRKDSYSKNIPLQLILFFFSLGVFWAHWEGILQIALQLTDLLPGKRYERYLLQDERLLGVEQFGTGFFVLCSINLILILFSNKVKAFYNDRFINILYDLFFVGTLIEYLCLANMLTSRINVFFIDNRFILCGFYLYYFLHTIPEKVAAEQEKQIERKEYMEKCIRTRERANISFLLAAVLLLADLAIFVGYLSKASDPDSTIIYHFFWEFE